LIKKTLPEMRAQICLHWLRRQVMLEKTRNRSLNRQTTANGCGSMRSFSTRAFTNPISNNIQVSRLSATATYGRRTSRTRRFSMKSITTFTIEITRTLGCPHERKKGNNSKCKETRDCIRHSKSKGCAAGRAPHR
jgi:hypothetical protein